MWCLFLGSLHREKKALWIAGEQAHCSGWGKEPFTAKARRIVAGIQLQSCFSADHSSSHLPCGFPRQQLSRAGSRDLGKNPTKSCICWKKSWACPAKSSCLFMLWVVATVILGGGCVQHVQPGQSLEVQPWSGAGGICSTWGAGKAVPVFAPAAGVHPHSVTPINPRIGCSLAGAQPAPVWSMEASRAAKLQ